VRKFLANAEAHVAGLLLMAVTLLVVIQLALPAMTREGSSSLTALILGLFFWATLLGIPAATRRGAHLSLVFLRRHVPARWAKHLRTGALIASLAFFGVLAWTGAWMCISQARYHNRFLSQDCPDWVVSVAIPLAALLSCVRAVQAWSESRAEG